MKVAPPVTRSLLVLEMAEELALHRPVRRATASLDLGEGRRLALFGSSTIAGIEAVAAREVDLAIVNPSAMLTLAYRGNGPFDQPLPLRTIAVIPSHDYYLFAVRPETGLRTFEEIAAKRPVLRIGVRAARDHSLHFILDDVMRASGFSRADLIGWGSHFRYEGGVPEPGSQKLRAFIGGALDALWEEGADLWLDAALDAGMNILTLTEPTMQRLEQLGYRRAVIPRSRHARLEHDILTLDFSGWPLFVHAELPDDEATAICAALAARVARVPWQEEKPLTVERMFRDTAEAPYDVPLHPAAERYWREHAAPNG